MEKSKALIVKEKGVLEFVELPKPQIGDYEVLFRTKACSLCTVDRRVYLGKRSKRMPFLGGHECSGVVEAVGKGVVELKPGDHVVFTSAYCMQCELDRVNHGTQCQNKTKLPQRVAFDGTIMGGGLSEYLAIPAWQLMRMPQEVDFRHSSLTEPLACCVHSIRKARIRLGETVLIIGMGIMGYFHLKLALMQGARVIVSETDPKRQQLALANGAWKVIDPNREDALEALRSVSDRLGADVVVNTIAVSSIWDSALAMLAPYGRLIAYSSQDSQEKIGIDFGKVHSREIEVIGTLNPTLEDNEIATRLIRYGLIDMEPVIDAVYPFAQGIEAFKAACEPGRYRVVIEY